MLVGSGYAGTVPQGLPHKNKIVSRYGLRIHPITRRKTKHEGIDIKAPPGTPVKATGAGIVVFVGWHFGRGLTIMIKHTNKLTTVYAHNSRLLVKMGQKVKRGTVVALSGATGFVTGPHIHYEVLKNDKRVNPLNYVVRTKYKKIKLSDNPTLLR